MIAFLFLIACALTLLTFTIACQLIIDPIRQLGPSIGLIKFLGLIVSVIAIFLFLLTCYFGFRFWDKGFFEPPIIVKTPSRKVVPRIPPFIPKATQPLEQLPKEEKSPKIDSSKSLPV